MLKNNKVLGLITGLLLAISWPTYGIPILLFFAFVPLLIAEKNIRVHTKKRKAWNIFLVAYIAFVTWNAITTWWLWYSTPFGMLFAVLVNALLMALIFLIYHLISRRLSSKIGLIFFIALWISFEKFHLNWPFSWPWLNLGNAFSEHTSWIQWYEFTGTFGGSLWILLINVGYFKAIENYKILKDKKLLGRGIAIQVLGISLPIIISLLMLSYHKEPEKTVDVVLLQPNVDPYTEKFNRSNLKTVRELLTLSRSAISDSTDFMIAPETVLSKLSAIDKFETSREKFLLQSLIHQHRDLNLLLGGDFFRLFPSDQRPSDAAIKTSRGDWAEVYNAAILLNRNDSIQFYVKSKLVVGVEQFPFKRILEPLLGDIMINLGGASSSRATQKDRVVFTSANQSFRAAPVICYESVYGEFVTDYVSKGANFLTIITNDAWWDNTQGHKQHLSYAKLRAIETRRSIARSANTGISALINTKGDIIESLAYEKQGVITGKIAVNEKMTFYVRFGDYIARIASLLAGLIFIYAIAIKRKPKKSLSPIE